MKIVAFQYGTTEITERMAFRGGDKTVKLPIALLFFLIEQGERKILVDVGCDTMPGFPLFTFEPPVKVLESYGVMREEITDVILTHSHHDHIDGVRHYPQALIHLHEAEWEKAQKYLPDRERVAFFTEGKTLSDRIGIRHIGGHSAGSSVVLIPYGDRTVVLCGDECYTKDNLRLALPTGSSISPERSQAFVEEYRKEHYIPILFHDPDLLPGIGAKVLFEVDG